MVEVINNLVWLINKDKLKEKKMIWLIKENFTNNNFMVNNYQKMKFNNKKQIMNNKAFLNLTDRKTNKAKFLLVDNNNKDLKDNNNRIMMIQSHSVMKTEWKIKEVESHLVVNHNRMKEVMMEWIINKEKQKIEDKSFKDKEIFIINNSIKNQWTNINTLNINNNFKKDKRYSNNNNKEWILNRDKQNKGKMIFQDKDSVTNNNFNKNHKIKINNYNNQINNRIIKIIKCNKDIIDLMKLNKLILIIIVNYMKITLVKLIKLQ